MLRRFLRDTRGNYSLILAIVAVPLIAAAGAAIDYSEASKAKSVTRDAMDAAVLAGVAVGGTEANQIETARDFFLSNLPENVRFEDLKFAVNNGKLTGTAKAVVETTFLEIVSISSLDALVESAATRVMMPGSLRCIHSLAASADSALILNSKPRSSDIYVGASLMANSCVVQVNSTSPKATLLKAGSFAAKENNFGGGFAGALAGISPTPIIKSPPVADPFAGKNIALPPCDVSNASFSGTTVTVSPKHYCGRFTVSGTDVIFEPGTYYFSGGSILVSASRNMSGNGVSFVTGPTTTTIEFDVDAVNWKAAAKGDAAAFLIFNQSRLLTKNILRAEQHLYLEGIVYSPANHFELRWRRPATLDSPYWTAPRSPFTAFIARTLDFHGYSQLILNHDASKTDLPVPAALATQTGTPRLLY